MRRLFTLLLTLASVLPGGIVIDRLAVIVGSHAIKSSDILRGLRLTEFMNREPVNLGSGEMRNEAERLIDQVMIRVEVARGGYRRPAAPDADRLIRKLVQDRFGGREARLREALSGYGLSENELREQLLWQLTVLRFIDQRFRPGAQISDADVRAYYDKHLAELAREHPGEDSLDALQARIRASLEGERINQDFEAWLSEERKHVRIEYLEGAFQ